MPDNINNINQPQITPQSDGNRTQPSQSYSKFTNAMMAAFIMLNPDAGMVELDRFEKMLEAFRPEAMTSRTSPDGMAKFAICGAFKHCKDPKQRALAADMLAGQGINFGSNDVIQANQRLAARTTASQALTVSTKAFLIKESIGNTLKQAVHSDNPPTLDDLVKLYGADTKLSEGKIREGLATVVMTAIKDKNLLKEVGQVLTELATKEMRLGVAIAKLYALLKNNASTENTAATRYLQVLSWLSQRYADPTNFNQSPTVTDTKDLVTNNVGKLISFTKVTLGEALTSEQKNNIFGSPGFLSSLGFKYRQGSNLNGSATDIAQDQARFINILLGDKAFMLTLSAEDKELLNGITEITTLKEALEKIGQILGRLNGSDNKLAKSYIQVHSLLQERGKPFSHVPVTVAEPRPRDQTRVPETQPSESTE
jgi:hypothetical protein